jgi:hypothetical protein
LPLAENIQLEPAQVAEVEPLTTAPIRPGAELTGKQDRLRPDFAPARQRHARPTRPRLRHEDRPAAAA